MYRVAIITLSDTASKGERIDESGRVIAEIVRNEGYEVVFQKICLLYTSDAADDV